MLGFELIILLFDVLLFFSFGFLIFPQFFIYSKHVLDCIGNIERKIRLKYDVRRIVKCSAIFIKFLSALGPNVYSRYLIFRGLFSNKSIFSITYALKYHLLDLGARGE